MHQQRLDLHPFFSPEPSTSRCIDFSHPAHDFHPQPAPSPSTTSASTPSTCHRKLERSHPQSHNSNLTLATRTHLRLALKYHQPYPTNDHAEHPQPSVPDFHQRSDHPTNSSIMANLDNINMSNDQNHPANHQADLESMPSSSAVVQKHQSFEATTAVLDTNELLHMIIAEVPLQHRTSLLQISKTWNVAVIKIGYTLQPSGYHTKNPFQEPASLSLLDNRYTCLHLANFSRFGFPGLPMLSSVAAFVINPLLPEETTDEYPDWVHAASRFFFSPRWNILHHDKDPEYH